MENIKDNIYDAYYLKKGDAFGKKVRERIHWIVQNTIGTNILDIGCSQGITSILLGREGKRVCGIDASSTAIEDATQNLLKEEEETQSYVSFKKCNFFRESFDEKFDSVIIGEVLEHINDIDTFFTKAVSHTKEDGRIIVTTPFGINEFIDHKRTFYISEFLKLQNDEVIIEGIKFFGKWIGVVFKKTSDSKKMQMDDLLLTQFEQVLYQIEEQHLSQNNHLQNRLKQVKETTGKDSNQQYLNEKVEKVKIQKELFDVYSENESLIAKYKNLAKDYELLQTRYYNIRNSKLGRIATKYWKMRNKRRDKVK